MIDAADFIKWLEVFNVDYGPSAGTGSVNVGAINELAYYAAAGDTVSGLATANNGLLVTDASGVPSIGNAIGDVITVLGARLGTDSGDNLFFGDNALLVADNTLASRNVAFGSGALSSNVSADNNIAVGYNALATLSSGTNQNIAIGSRALTVLASGSSQIGIGHEALLLADGGVGNVAIGDSAGAGTVASGACLYIGHESGKLNDATNCVALGNLAMTSATAAATTVAIGSRALFAVTTGSLNTAVGYRVGEAIGTGSVALTTGGNNTLIGGAAGVNDAACADAIAIGRNSVTTIATGVTSGDDGPGIAFGSVDFPVGFRGDGTIYPGSFARVGWNSTKYMLPLQADGATSIAVTSGGTGLSSTTANQILYSSATNTIAGLATANNGLLLTSAAGVPSIGNAVLADTSFNGVRVGRGAGGVATTINIGSAGGASLSGANNVFISTNVPTGTTTAANNIGIGRSSLAALTSGLTHVCIGTSAGAALTTATAGCTLIGHEAGMLQTAGNVVGIGLSVFPSSTSAANNVGIGKSVGANFASGGVSLVTGDDNLFFGLNATGNNSDTSGALAMGANAVANIATGATSSDDGPGIAIGSSTNPIGFRGDGTIYPTAGASAGYWKVKINGTLYKIELLALS